ncbi:MAG: amino acid adenylation domain-containing protein [Candidatus Aminicenantes bacterium]|nr:MAG: amino acid adenylation domain-containing protein [Candidatus Aminicenantes bacterium]
MAGVMDNYKGKILCPDQWHVEIEKESGENPGLFPGGDSPAYIIYTSGSTGKPKGAGVFHSGFFNLMNWFVTQFKLGAHDRNLLVTSLSFDLTQKNIFAPLITGGILILPGLDYFDPGAIQDIILEKGVTWLNCTPGMIYKIIEHQAPGSLEKLSSLKYLFLGGEPIAMNMLWQWVTSGYFKGEIVNTYGPTECTDICAFYPVKRPGDFLNGAVPIGKPVNNTGLLVLDRCFQPLPIGAAGELFIGGKGLGLGYINDVRLTSEKFIKLPLTGDSLWYRSGDLVKRLPDGNIEFIGRVDFQVKIRGFRIEPGEIENHLMAHEQVKAAVVIALERHPASMATASAERYLCAYIVSDEALAVTGLREYLSSRLPSYMVPSYFVRLEKIPLTPHGKIDRRLLPEPDGESETPDVRHLYVAPRGEKEKKLAAVWREVTGVKRIGMTDNFFELGGDSLLVIRAITRMREVFGVELPVRKFFQHPTIKELAGEIETLGGNAVFITKAPPGVDIPLSFAQERLWFLHQLDSETTAYFVPRVVRMIGQLNVAAVEQTFNEITRRHEILRTVFPTVEGRPVQRVQAHTPFKLNIIDLSGMAQSFQNEEVTRWIKEEGQRPFDFEKGPMIRITLLRLKPTEHLLVITEHHLIHDGWTQGVLLKEFITLFTAFSKGKPAHLPGLPIQYGDFAYWQRQQMQGEVLENHLAYWKEKLSGLPPILNLPTDRPRPPVISGKGAEKRLFLSKSLSDNLIAFSRQKEVTLFMTMLAVFNVLLYRYTGSNDLCIGTGMANRRYKETEGMLGMVINTLALRNWISGELSFDECLQRVKTTCLEAYEHEDTPFEKVVEIIQPERSLSYTPVFQVVLSFMDTPSDRLQLPGLKLEVEAAHNRSSKFDINIIVEPPTEERSEETGGRIEIVWEYNTDIFDDTTTDQMMSHYNRLLQEILTHADKKISRLPMLDKGELDLLLYTLNNTKAEYPNDKTLRQLFEEQAGRTPDHTALVLDDRVLSYRELNKKANQTAHLLKAKGLTWGSIAAVMEERQPGVITGIIAVLKCAAAYLPVDPEYPETRLIYMIKDSQARLVLSQHPLPGEMSLYAEAIHIDEEAAANGESSNPGIASHPKDPAYVLYTSGSTGAPKGVVIEQLSVINLAWAQKEVFNIDERDHILQFSSLCFDASVEQIFIALFSGSVLVLVGKNTLLDKDKFGKYLLNHQVTHIHAVPSFLETIEMNDFYPLKRVVAGGDTCPVELAVRWHKHCRFYNEYGPTETTVTSIELPVRQVGESVLQLPIGRPLHNTYIYILDQGMGPVPFGVTGELYIGGVGVARGYLNNPELTAEKFVRAVNGHSSLVISSSSKFSPNDQCPMINDRFYRTGDLARWLPDGNLEFLGRIDFQVKVRGFRIELGEIESRLLHYKKNFTFEGITYCKRCLLSSNYPGIHFDKEGICSVCREYEEYKDRIGLYFEGIEVFKKLMERAGKRKRSKYDCMLLFSGGKDSSYVLYRLVEMGLKVLAFTFDNGYISATAFENIRRITSALKVESIVSKTDNMKEIFRECLKYDHTVCSGCFKALTTISTQLAVERNINVIVTGLSRGQIMDTKLSGLASQNIFNVPEIEEKLLLFRKMYHSTPDKTSKLLNINLEDNIFDDIYFVDFFRYDDTPQEKIKDYLRERDVYWHQPGDTGFCSTNCIINDVGIYVHLKDRGYHNYEAPLSWDCRLGQGKRGELLEEVQYKVDLPKVQEIFKEIGYREQPIQEAVVVDKKDARGDKYLSAYFVSDRDIDVDELRKYLSNELPGYMIPSFFIKLDKIPLTPNGKIDRKALPAPERGNVPVDFTGPRDDIEMQLVEIWSEVLGISKEKISIDANFFHLGGHSLKVTVLASRIHKEFNINVPLSEIFKTPHIRGLASYIKEMARSNYVPVEPVEKKEYYYLSSAQRRLYILQQMDAEKGIAYNIPSVWQVQGELDTEKFAGVFLRLVRRHESLRTFFTVVSDEHVQRVHEETVIDHWSLVIGEAEESEIEDIIKNFIKPFDLSQAPLLRVRLIKLPHTTTTLRGHPSQEGKEGEYILMVDMHHIISDGLSIGIFVKEFTQLYGGKSLPALRLQYRDYSEWHNRQVGKEFMKEQKNYWLKQFKWEAPVLDLPADYPRPSVQSFSGGTVHFEINKEETAALKSLAREQDVTLFMLLLSVYTIFLCKLSGQEDIVVGTPIASRRHTDLEGIFGMFVNTLALRNFPVMEKTFGQFLGEVKENTIKAFENQDYLYEDLVDQVEVERDIGRNPLFDTMFALQNVDTPAIEIPGLKVMPYHYKSRKSKFDLTLAAVEIEDRLSFTFEYCISLFKRETIQRFIGFFKKTVTTVLENYETRISGIDIITGEERKRILFNFNDTLSVYPGENTLHGNFEEKAERTPDQLAVVYKDRQLNYRELHETSNWLSQVLRVKGVKADMVVGLMVKRSLDMIIGIMGILKAGGAYLPIDVDYQEERTNDMLADSSVKVLVTTIELYKEDSKIRKWKEERNLEIVFLNFSYLFPFSTTSVPLLPASYPTNLAYVIYTSGTTGTPKGAMIEHKSVLNLVIGLKEKVYFYENAINVSWVSPIIFDASIKQIFPSLLLGHKLEIVPEEERFDGEKLIAFYKERRIRVADGTPAHLNILINYQDRLGWLFPVEQFIVGGEELGKTLCEKFISAVGKKEFKIINVYGPTECCDVTTSYRIVKETINEHPRIPIGRPLGNMRVYIFSAVGELQPIGIPGELFIAGRGVARGYLNRPELTAEKFILATKTQRHKDVYFSWCLGALVAKLYKTGDLARWLPDGNIEFLGRSDRQLKIRGYRIELEEIEGHLSSLEKVEEATVIAGTDEKGDNYLCAYIGSNLEIPISELRLFLLRRLPGYMVPSYFVRLEHLPRTSSGKVDRKALPAPGFKVDAGKYAAPTNSIEKKLVDIWSEILDVEKEKIGINDNFFHLGGHSLKATIFAARLHQTMDVKFSLKDFFQGPTIREISNCIQGAVKQKFFSIETIEKKEYYNLSSAQKRLFTIEKLANTGNVYNISAAWVIKGRIEKNLFEDTFNRMIKRHDSLRTSFTIIDGQPVQVIHEHVNFEIESLKLSGHWEHGEPGITSIINDFIKPFDLEKPPLLKALLVEFAHEEHLFLLDMHHIITDGFSNGIFINDFMALYREMEPRPLRVQYKDFSQWQNREKGSETQKKQEKYWLERFSDGVPVVDIPKDFPRPLVQSFEGDIFHFVLDSWLSGALKRLTQQTKTTLNMVLLAAYAILLSKYSGEKDIVVGLGISGRTHPDVENIIGFFVNTLPIKIQPQPDKTYSKFLHEVKDITLAGYENQEYPFEELVRKLGVTGDLSQNPLFNAAFVVQNMEIDKIEIEGLEITPYDFKTRVSRFDFQLVASEANDSITMILEYSIALFKRVWAEKFAERYVNILKQVVENNDIKLKDITISHHLTVAKPSVSKGTAVDFNF